MNHADALRALCSLLKAGDLMQSPERDDPVHLFAGTCKIDQHEPTRDVALYSWKLQPTHMWCRPFAERQVIWVDLDKKRRVNAITSMCPEMII